MINDYFGENVLSSGLTFDIYPDTTLPDFEFYSYDNIYNFTLEGGYIPNDNWEFKLRWIYAGGAPYTPFNIEKSIDMNRGIWDFENLNSKRLPDYHSLNIRVDKRFYFSGSNLIIYLSVWNAYGRENIAQYVWDEKENKLDYQKQWSTLPVLGVEFEF